MHLSGVKACRLEQLEPRLLMSSVSASEELFASAESLTIGPKDSIVVDGDISVSGELDVYQFTTSARGRLTIDLSAAGDGIDPYLELFTSGGRRVRRNNNASRDTLDSRISLNVRAGRTYYLVASAGIDDTGGYALSLTSDPRDDVGDSQETAKLKRLSRSRGSKSFSGTVNYANDVDFFMFTATQSGLMQINQTVRGRNNSLQGHVLVYDANNQLVATSNDPNGGTSLDVVRGERYYLAVTGQGDTQGKYKIKIARTQTHLFASAAEVDVPSEGSIVINADRQAASASHGYTFTAKAKGFVYIDMQADGGGIDSYLRVYNSRHRRIGRNDNASAYTTDSRIRLRVKAGQTYYIEADARLGTSGAYELTITSDPVDDMGNSFGEAKGITLKSSGAKRTKGRINYGDDVDLLSLVATTTGTMSVDMLSLGRRNNLAGEISAYNGEGELLTQEAGNHISFFVVEGQRYYLEAASVGNSTGKYRLDLSTVPGEMAPQAPPQEAPQAGNAVTGEILSLAGGLQLVVSGTDASDTILLSQSDDYITVITSAGSTNFNGSFTSVVVYGFGGDDVIRLDSTVVATAFVYGGDGDDSIYEAGAGSATLYGQAGDDVIVSVGGNNDTLYGGLGFDSFWADSYDSVADAYWTERIAGTVHQITEFYQPETNNAWSEDYVSLQIAGQDIADPTLTGYATGYDNFSEFAVFTDGPQYDDVAQGAVGDCYLLVSLAGLADTDPEIITQMITSLGDGTYAVRFFRDGKEVYVRLDADLPVNSYGSLAYADQSSDGEIWVPLVEKAYAYFRRGQNSYASLNGGWMGDVYREITGQSTAARWTGGDAGNLFTFMENSLLAGHTLSVGSYRDSNGPIVGSHAYVVKSVESTEAGDFVTLYNPWGVDGRAWDNNYQDGLLVLSITDVQEHFFAVVMSAA